MASVESKEMIVLSPDAVLVADPAAQYPVDARKLHAWLEVNTDFTKWFKARCERFKFRKIADFSPFLAKTQGRPIQEFHITLRMAQHLCMVEWTDKGEIARDYFIACEDKLKQLIIGKKQWHLAREDGKASRRVETDVIKSFVEYAKRQGSESADLYFMNFSKMVNAALLELDGNKSPGRDQLNTLQLHSISVAESIVAKTLIECMTKALPYKEVYQIAKKRISAYAEAVGKTRPGISAREYVGLIA